MVNLSFCLNREGCIIGLELADQLKEREDREQKKKKRPERFMI